MAVFYNTGDGDIYAGETKEACIAAMKEDCGEKEFATFEAQIREEPGSKKILLTDEYGEPTDPPEYTTLTEEYTDMGHGYFIASNNF